MSTMPQSTAARVFLFIQGPMSPFFSHVAKCLIANNVRIVKIHICFADTLFWQHPGAYWYQGKMQGFANFVADLCSKEKVTDLIVWGDCRIYHQMAIDIALKMHLQIHAMECGYLRPDWLTIESVGLNSFSQMPRHPDIIRQHAVNYKEPNLKPIANNGFFLEAVYALLFGLSNLLVGTLFFPHYQRHAIRYPLTEYAAWFFKIIKFPFTAIITRAHLFTLAKNHSDIFLVPLQLETDFQIRTHSPFPTLKAAIEWILLSFSQHARASAQLLFKVHPLDSGADGWSRWIKKRARAHGIAQRTIIIDGGNTDELILQAKGIVTINSTVGLAALKLNVPVIALGNAVFDVEGLTHQNTLASFWNAPEMPDPDLTRDFLTLLVHTTQVRGGVIMPSQIAIGAKQTAEIILKTAKRMSAVYYDARISPVFRRQIEWQQSFLQ